MVRYKKFMITKALKFGAFGVFEHFGVFFVLTLIALFERIVMLASFALVLGMKLLKGFTDHQFFSTQFLGNIFLNLSLKIIIIILALYLLFMFSNGYISAVLTKVGFDVYDTGDAHLKDLKVGWSQIKNLIIGMILYGIIVTLGLFCFIVPGVIFGIRYGYYRYFIIDKNMKTLAAFKSSARLTRRSSYQIASLWLILGMFNTLGAFFWGIGLFITLPLSLLANIYVYRRLLFSYE